MMPQLTYSTGIIFNTESDKNRLLEVLIAERSVWNECSKIKFGIKNNSITVIKVAASYTSQIDCRTDQRDGQRNGRVYIGKDGKHLDADINAACNIAKRSKLPCLISNYYSWQATVNSPIVGVPS